MKSFRKRQNGDAALIVRAESLAPADAQFGRGLGEVIQRDDAPGGLGDLRRIFLILRDRWRLIAAVTAIVVVATALGTLLQPRVYRATGIVELHGQSADVVPVEAIFQAERLSLQYLETQYGVLRSAALARLVIGDIGKPLVEDLGGGDAEVADAQKGTVSKGLTDAFSRKLIVDPTVGSSLVRIHYESSDPALAARVVNAVFESYGRLQAEAGGTAVKRLAIQVDSIRDRLSASERELQLYAQANNLDVVESETGTTSSLPHERLRDLEEQYTAAQADVFAKQSLRTSLSGNDALDSDLLRALNVRLATLRGEYAKLRATFSDEYPRTREVREQLSEQEALLRRERARIRGEISSQYAAAVQRQNLLKAAIDSQRSLVDRQGEKGTHYRILTRDVEAQRQLYAMLQQKLRGAQVSSAVASTQASVVEAAIAPTDPIRPQPARNLQLALLAGLLLGVGAAFAREYAGGTIRTVDEVDALPIPFLGAIPSIRRPLHRDHANGTRRLGAGIQSVLAGDSDEDGPVLRIDHSLPGEPYDGSLQDAFGTLRTSVLFNATQHGGARSLLITSARPGEGKTTISVNLALSLSRLGRRVLLIDADMRRPAVHRILGIEAECGLADVLSGGTPWTSIVTRDAAPGLDVIAAGRISVSPTEALASDRMTTLLEEAEGAYEFVVVDSPALDINAADTRILAPLVDGVIFVMRSGVTQRAVVARLLRHVPNIAGVVLNDLSVRDFPNDYYSYGKPSGDAAVADSSV